MSQYKILAPNKTLEIDALIAFLKWQNLGNIEIDINIENLRVTRGHSIPVLLNTTTNAVVAKYFFGIIDFIRENGIILC